MVTQLGTLRKIKKKRVLALSLGGPGSGVQSVYTEVSAAKWEVLSQAFLPYPQKLIEKLSVLSASDNAPVTLQDLSFVENRMTSLVTECASSTLAQVAGTYSRPHLAVLGRLFLWKGLIDDSDQQKRGLFSLCNPQSLCAAVRVPVFTDIVPVDWTANGKNDQYIASGMARIGKKTGGVCVFVNIGLVCRMIITDSSTDEIVLDSDTGPGTCLINRVMHDCGTEGGIDRDGTLAAQGSVANDCIESLAEEPWFQMPAPKTVYAGDLYPLLDKPCMKNLPTPDRIATVTALTARTIYNFFKREYKGQKAVNAVYVTGGGAHNQTLFEYLKMHFDPIPVNSTDTLGISPDLFIPLALGISAAAALDRGAGNPMLIGTCSSEIG